MCWRNILPKGEFAVLWIPDIEKESVKWYNQVNAFEFYRVSYKGVQLWQRLTEEKGCKI